MQEITKKNARIWSMLGMRRVVGLILKEMAKEDEKFTFATADMARYLGAGDFKELFPDQFIDVGIAEQNLIGISAGLQKEGFHVFAGTYATFITARVLDQIRVNLGYMNLGVKLIGAAGGLSDGNFSPTHMAVEDIANTRAIPNIVVISPADGVELVKAMYALKQYAGPAYLRLSGRTNLQMIYTQDYEFQIGRAICLREGRDIALIATGTMVGMAQKVAKNMQEVNISCKVIDMHTIKPLDTKTIDELSDYRLIVSIEEHMVAGGLGSAIAEYLADKKERPVHQIIAINDFYPAAGEYELLLECCGLSEDKITDRIMQKYKTLSS